MQAYFAETGNCRSCLHCRTALVIDPLPVVCLRRYVAKPEDKVGNKLKLNVRGKLNEAEIVKTPFVPARYYKKPA